MAIDSRYRLVGIDTAWVSNVQIGTDRSYSNVIDTDYHV
jgi:hypothetical protein